MRPCKSYEGVRSRYEDVDLVIVRENTEDLYAGIEFEKGTDELRRAARQIQKLSGAQIREDAGISIKPISDRGHAPRRHSSPSTTPAQRDAARSRPSTRPTS